MSRTSTVVWSVIGLIIVMLGGLVLIYGPGLYREGKAIVGPIVDIAQSEERLSELNTEMPFEQPGDGSVTADQFSVFLAIRRDLLPHYVEWQAIERQLEQHEPEDWESAREMLVAIQEVMTVQTEILQTHGMSPAEFVWIEDLIYVTWTEQTELLIESSVITETIRETTARDMDSLAELERKFGSSRTTKEFAALLDQRLSALDNPAPPTVEGVPDASSALFWQHREELEDLDFARYSELHDILRGGNTVRINLEDD